MIQVEPNLGQNLSPRLGILIRFAKVVILIMNWKTSSKEFIEGRALLSGRDKDVCFTS